MMVDARTTLVRTELPSCVSRLFTGLCFLWGQGCARVGHGFPWEGNGDKVALVWVAGPLVSREHGPSCGLESSGELIRAPAVVNKCSYAIFGTFIVNSLFIESKFMRYDF